MHAIQSDSRFTDQHERELIRREMNMFPFRSGRTAPAGATPDESGNTRYSKALAVFKGALIVSAVVFVTITLALQAAARFS
jgi:hypothetical protein